MGAAFFQTETLLFISERSMARRVETNSLDSSFRSATTPARFLPFSTLTGMVPPQAQHDAHEHAGGGRGADHVQRIVMRHALGACSCLREFLLRSDFEVFAGYTRFVGEFFTGFAGFRHRVIHRRLRLFALAAANDREPLLCYLEPVGQA